MLFLNSTPPATTFPFPKQTAVLLLSVGRLGVGEVKKEQREQERKDE